MQYLPPLRNGFSISVLICTRNRFDATMKCVGTLVMQTHLPDELVVVDSSSDLGLEMKLRDAVEGSGITLRYQHSAPGLALQRNLGVAMTSSRVIIFLDDDTVLDKGYVAAVAKIYAEDKEGTVAGIQGSFMGETKLRRLGTLFRRLFLLPGPTGWGLMQASGFPSYIKMPDRVIDVDMICGGNTAYRREVLDRFKWNEAFCGYSYMEDDDYSYRVSREFRLVQTPDARLVHEHAPGGRDNMEKAVRMEVRNHALFFKLNMPKTPWNRTAFVWSEIGCCLLTFRTYGLYGLLLRLKAYVEPVPKVGVFRKV